MADPTPRLLFEFATSEAARDWQAVNDGVMGGVSDGRFRLSDRKTLEFFGTLSLENNGGFASVRSKPRKLDLQPGDTILLRVKGDGRQYSLNLYVNRPLVAFSYRAALPTEKEQWTEVKIPLTQFEATSFGRPVRNAAAVDPKDIVGLGVLLGDKKPGKFNLEIDWIKVIPRGD